MISQTGGLKYYLPISQVINFAFDRYVMELGNLGISEEGRLRLSGLISFDQSCRRIYDQSMPEMALGGSVWERIAPGGQ